MSKSSLQGTLYRRGKRWWWKVRKPGQENFTFLPLKPRKAKFATTDRATAESLAQGLWLKWTLEAGDRPEVVRTMSDLVKAYLAHCREYYRGSREVDNVRRALGHVLTAMPDRPTEEFGPKALKTVRESMIEDGLARKTVNQRVNVIKRMMRWAVSEETVPPSAAHALDAVAGLRRGRSRARETRPVLPVPVNHALETARFAPRVIADMIRLQMLVGMRPGELCLMQPCHLTRVDDEVTLFEPPEHKNAWRDQAIVYAIGPQGMKVLNRYLARRDPFEYIFSPADSEERRRQANHRKRKVPLHYGNTRGTNRKDDPKRTPGEHYTVHSYRRAVRRAITAANKAGKKIPSWSPNQLRHTRGTTVREQYDAEHARTALAHKHLRTTEIYAEIDLAKAIKVARETG